MVKLLEINPNPGWCWDGKLNMMAGFDGMRYAYLLAEILRVARERNGSNGQNTGRAALGKCQGAPKPSHLEAPDTYYNH